jgi:hypothetical protein
MTDAQRLSAVRALHTAIYVVMSVGIFVILFAGVTGRRGLWLWVALGLLALETAVFGAGGMRCPLTGIVDRYASGARVADTYFPERFTRHTLQVFGPLLAVGVTLVVLRLALGRWTG